ncbi:MAG: hypothetical protein M1836_001189 [Candelina mexicana]|nr:MAG: hypothetical protein M1836_001189 [Candelina mexicana]
MNFLTEHLSVAIVATAFLVYCIAGVIYRLYLSPIAKFPGPKLAATTLWFEFYYDIIKRGQYTFRIQEMHEKYGPIVRISPYELHIKDSEYYDELYSRSSRRDKYAWFSRQFGSPTSSFGTPGHDLHRLRRAAINPFFSKQRAVALTPVIQGTIEKLCKRFEVFRQNGEAIRIRLPYVCMTTDIITEYAMARTMNYVEAPGFYPPWDDLLMSFGKIGYWVKQFGWIYPVMQKVSDWMPSGVLTKWAPGLEFMVNFQKRTLVQVKEIVEGKDKEYYLSKGHPTVFHELLQSDLPPQEKEINRLWDEGQVIIAAGTGTTAHSLEMMTFHLLDDPTRIEKLRAELKTVMPDPQQEPKLQELEKLPYLTGIILEGLRFSYGAATRLQRIAPDEDLQYREWSIPRGTPVGMTSVFMHQDPTIFPDPQTFRPERWMDLKERQRLDRYLVPFSKGSRQCAGINLALAEMYLTLATVHSRFNLELFETTREDVDMKHDFFFSAPHLASKGVRVVFK